MGFKFARSQNSLNLAYFSAALPAALPKQLRKKTLGCGVFSLFWPSIGCPCRTLALGKQTRKIFGVIFWSSLKNACPQNQEF